MIRKDLIIYILVLLFVICLDTFNLHHDGGIPKLIVTISAYLALFFCVRSFYLFKFEEICKLGVVYKFDFILFFIILLWGSGLILKSLGSHSVLSVFGNNSTGLSILVTLFFLLGLNAQTFISFVRFNIYLIPIAILSIPYFPYISYWITCTLPFAFLFFKYLSKKERLLLIIGLFGYLYITFFIFEKRLALAYISISVFSVLASNITKKVKLIKYISVFCILIPFILFAWSIYSGVSFFEYLFSDVDENVAGVDTRTFLYLEFFEDMIQNKCILLGKGVCGTYFSQYFLDDPNWGDHYQRLNIEVAFLSLWLKGGLIYVVLHIFIVVRTILQSLFDSKSEIFLAIGFFIIGYFNLMFIEMVFFFDPITMFFWMLLGFSVYKQNRELNDESLKLMFSEPLITNSRYYK